MRREQNEHSSSVARISSNRAKVLVLSVVMALLIVMTTYTANGEIIDLHVGLIGSVSEDENDYEILTGFVLKWGTTTPVTTFKIIEPDGDIHYVGGDVREKSIANITKTFSKSDYEVEDLQYLYMALTRHLVQLCYAFKKTGTWRVEVICGSGADETKFEPYLNENHYNTVGFERLLFSYPCRGTSIDFVIQYDTNKLGQNSDLSYGWNHSYNMWFEQVNIEGDPVNLLFHLGLETERAIREGDDDYDSPNPYMEIEDIEDIDSGDKLRLRIKGTEYIFSWSTKMIESMTTIMEREENLDNIFPDNLGHKIEFNYYPDDDPDYRKDKLKEIIDSSGRDYAFIYWDTSDPDYNDDPGGLVGKLKKIIHPDDSTILAKFYYDATNNNLLKVYDAVDQTTEYVYRTLQGGDNLLLIHVLEEIHPSSGTNTYYEYKNLYEFDDPTTSEEVDIPVVTYSFVANGPNKNDAVFGSVSITQSNDLDDEGNIMSCYKQTEDAEGWVVETYYGKTVGKRFGNPILKQVDGEGTVTMWTYDEHENQIRKVVTNEDDYWLITVNKYYEEDEEDAIWGNVRRTITRKVEDSGFDPEDSYGGYDNYYEYLGSLPPDYKYEYDDEDQAWGRVITTIDSTGVEEHKEYKEDEEDDYTTGMLQRTWIEPAEPDDTVSQEITFEYIESGDNEYLLSKKTAKLGPDESDIVTEYSYYDTDDHKEGMISQVLVKEGSAGPTLTDTDYTYDSSVSFGGPTAIEETGQNGRRTTEYVYDGIGRLATRKLPPAELGGLRQKTVKTYHWYNQEEEIIEYYGSVAAGWNATSRILKVYSSSSGWPETLWEFRDPTEETPNASVDLERSFEYYLNTELKSVTSPRGQSESTKTEYLYFENGLKQTTRYYKDATNYDSESFTYYPDKQVATTTNCRGKITEFEYDECNRLATVTDALDGETEYDYDEATTRVVSQTNPEGEETRYQYNDYGWLEKTTIVMGDPDDIVTEFDYDDATGKVIEEKKEMDPSTSNDDIITKHDYDVRGLIEKTTYAYGDDEETTTEYTYTDVGSVETETQLVEEGTSNSYIITKHEYDELDRNRKITIVMDPDPDIVTEYEYDSFTFSPSDPYVLRKDTVINPLDHKLEKTFNNFGQLVMARYPMNESDPNDDIVTEYDYDKNGNRIEETDAVGTITEFEYDYRDRLVETTYAVGTDLESTIQFELNVNGNTTKVTDQLAKETDYTYNDLDQLTKTTYDDDTTVELTRDDVGRVTHYKDQKGRITSFQYDDAGRLVLSTGPDGESVATTYDAEGNVKTRTDQEGIDTDYDYDNLNRLVTTTYEDTTTVERTYDCVGALASLTDQREYVTTYDYDDAGRLITVTYPDPDGAGGDPSPVEEYEYWATGIVKTHMDRNSNETAYEYDEQDRLELTTYPAGKEAKYIAYTYDKMGSIKTVTTKNSSQTQLSKVTRVYDELGRIEEETQELATVGTGKTVEYEYNDANGLTLLSYPGGKSLTFLYDDVYNVTAIKEGNDAIGSYTYNDAWETTRLDLLSGARANYTYDEMGRLESLVNRDPGGFVLSSYTYQRNKVGYPTRITYHDDRRRDYQYDDLYRLTVEEHTDAWASPISWHDYDYDDAGNRTSKQHDDGSGPELSYDYDNLNRLTDLTGYSGTRTNVTGTVNDDNVVSVTVSNLTTEEDFTAQIRDTLFIARGVELQSGDNNLQAAAVDGAQNEEIYPETGTHEVTLNNGDFDLDYTYDDNGCMTGDETYTYVYDYENRLIQVLDQSPATVAEFKYDGLGRRILSEIDSVETRFIYDGGSVIEEYLDDSGWVLEAEYVHGPGTDSPLSLERDSTTWYYHYDGLGSVTELTTSAGELVQAYEYDAWGNATIYDPDAGMANPYLYTGRRWDGEIGLYYYRARHYSPTLGRFLQPDPTGYKEGTNVYTYVGNTPTAFIDPSGMEKLKSNLWGDEAYWQAENPGLLWNKNVAKVYLGEVKNDKIHLRDKYGGGIVSYDEAKSLVANSEFSGGLSRDTRRTLITDTFASKGTKRGPGMLTAAMDGYVEGFERGAIVIADRAMLGMHDTVNQLATKYKGEARAQGDWTTQAGYGLGMVGADAFQAVVLGGVGKGLGYAARGVGIAGKAIGGTATAAKITQALTKVPGVVKGAKMALTGGRAIAGLGKAAMPYAKTAAGVTTGVATGYSGYQSGKSFASGDIAGGVHSAVHTLIAAKATYDLLKPTPKLYHYTSADPKSIEKDGLLPGKTGKVYTTPDGKLSPSRAVKELSLDPKRGLPSNLYEINVETLKNLGITIPKPTTIKGHYGMPGGGKEVVFPVRIPPEAIKIVR